MKPKSTHRYLPVTETLPLSDSQSPVNVQPPSISLKIRNDGSIDFLELPEIFKVVITEGTLGVGEAESNSALFKPFKFENRASRVQPI
jgi:hypothetical protein